MNSTQILGDDLAAELRDPNPAAPYLDPPKWYPWKLVLHLAALVGLVRLMATSDSAIQLLWIVLTASQLIAVYSIFHDAGHGHLSANRRVNEVLGVMLGMMLGTTFHGFRISHMKHHRHLRQEDDSQEVIHNAPHSRSLLALLLLIASVIGGAIFVWIRVPLLGARYLSTRRILGEMALAAAFLVTLATIILPEAARLPFLAAAAMAVVWGSLIDITYHQGLPTTGGLESSRSFDCDGFGFWILGGQNRHAEHHAYPAVPGPCLAKFSQVVRHDLAAGGAVYERGFTRAFIKALISGPAFLPPAEDRHLSQG